jgi:RNA recognition motif-containing protein
MGKKIYVGNLSYSVDSTALGEMFAEFGTVDSANVIMDRDSGRSKGFGFVEMSTEDAAQTAINKLNGVEKGGRALNVSEAKPQAPREGGGGRGGFGGGRGGGGGGGRGGFSRNNY